MPVYIFKDGKMVNKRTGEVERNTGREFIPATPMIMKPMPEYQSPIDGRVINSRQERKDDLAKHGCVEYEPSLSPTKGKFKNKRFAKKRGLKVSEEFL